MSNPTTVTGNYVMLTKSGVGFEFKATHNMAQLIAEILKLPLDVVDNQAPVATDRKGYIELLDHKVWFDSTCYQAAFSLANNARGKDPLNVVFIIR